MPTDVNLLLDRPYPDGYEEDFLALINRSENKSGLKLKLLVFLKGKEWFGLDTKTVSAVTGIKPLHSLPCPKEHIKGIVNFKGALKPVFSLRKLLSIPQEETDPKFMILISQDKEDWVFTADDVLGIFEMAAKDLQNVPVNIAKAHGNLVKAIGVIEDKTISILEEELLFFSLARE